MINIKVQNSGNESNANLLRRFRRATRSANIVNRKRSNQNYQRPPSDFKRKKESLRRKRRMEDVEKLIKLGKVKDRRRSKRVSLEDEEE